MDIWDYSLTGKCMLTYDGENRIMVHLTRIVAMTSDGQNHQSAWAAVYDTRTLTLYNRGFFEKVSKYF